MKEKKNQVITRTLKNTGMEDRYGNEANDRVGSSRDEIRVNVLIISREKTGA